MYDPNTPIGEVLHAVGSDGIILETEGNTYAVLPLDDNLIDYLLERNPKYIDSCQEIRQRMRAGQFRSHDEVKRRFSGE